MLSKLLKNKSVYSLLYKIDKAIAEKSKEIPCQYCGGPLHFANYPRKPRGEPEGISDEYFLRFSLCCGTEGCRRRIMPPSCRFLGRKIYWSVVILVLVVDFQKSPDAPSISEYSKKTGFSRKTIKRWIGFFQDIFPKSIQWQSIRGLVPASVKNDSLPFSLVDHFLEVTSHVEEAIVSCLKFLAGCPFDSS